jgi:3-oxoacyl-[acyl-carrier protein] reductase
MERVVRVHAFGPHYLSKLVIPHMRNEGRGDIIMISSVATLGMGGRGGPYNMGKAAMEALALTIAKEERQHGIRCNIVAPSLTVTEMGRRLTRATTGVEDIHELDARSPFGRVSTPRTWPPRWSGWSPPPTPTPTARRSTSTAAAETGRRLRHW